ncbi:hypothetical protein GCM10009409_36190 [Shewanella saliphila]|uniref:Uncharacterized protein n=1 Tax=Shewanella saliphila TaxID=2282698 RepID=A0ABQ2QAZ3_9GAMM|nr:hypothetical protein GCM10009409_36190 [Shewanella saliphila]
MFDTAIFIGFCNAFDVNALFEGSQLVKQAMMLSINNMYINLVSSVVIKYSLLGDSKLSVVSVYNFEINIVNISTLSVLCVLTVNQKY